MQKALWQIFIFYPSLPTTLHTDCTTMSPDFLLGCNRNSQRVSQLNVMVCVVGALAAAVLLNNSQ